MLKCIILDFDGTLTDVWQKADTFITGYQADLQRLCTEHHITPGDFYQQWSLSERTIRHNPQQFGWAIDGKIAAPAMADPFVMTGTICNHVMDAFRLLMDHNTRQESTQPLFQSNYRRAEPAFRPDTQEALHALQEIVPHIFVVTNSETDAVTRRLQKLGNNVVAHVAVHGHARKFLIGNVSDVDFSEVPETMEIQDLGRPIYLHRGHYLALLNSLWRTHHVLPQETLVAGDIFEMDLALPAALQCHIHLMQHQGTLTHERTAVKKISKGDTGHTLLELVARVQAMTC
jgi:FMN phosphatase YigB (HAD superfamily)